MHATCWSRVRGYTLTAFPPNYLFVNYINKNIHQSYLEYDSSHYDYCEERIIEKTFKHIYFSFFQFTAVNFIEYLQEDKSVEEDRIMDNIMFTKFI